MVLAEHFEVDAERGPSHAEVRLPLQLHVAAGDGQRRFAAVLVVERDGAGLGVDVLHGHVEHAAGLGRDRQERAIGCLTLGAERRQHDVHDGVDSVRPRASASRRTCRSCSSRSRWRTRTRSRRCRGSGAASRCCDARSFRSRRRRGWARLSAAYADAAPGTPCPARCPGSCACRPCRRRSTAAASCACLRSGVRRRGAPWSCARPRRRCRCAAGPRGHSRSRTAPSCPCRRAACPNA